MRWIVRRTALVGAALLAALACAPAGEEEVATAAGPPGVRPLRPPVADGSFAPDLTTAGDAVLMTWIERVEEEGEAVRHRVRFARLEGEAWSQPSTIVEGEDLFANWADFPSSVAAGDGSLYAHWLAKTAADTYAYSIFLARSTDGGATWEPLGRLNDDATPTEHGFVSWVQEGDGARAFWLDGREMTDEGPMGLRTALVTGSEVGPSELLDDRTCECCSTDAAVGPDGPMVVYRDRGAEEIRDVSIVRRDGEGWTEAANLHPDGWKIAGCPVNGPEIAVEGGRAAAAWFTAVRARPSVKAAFSANGGGSFGAPLLVDDLQPLGRVDVALDAAGAWVSWLATAGDRAEVRLRRLGEDGRAGEPVVVAETSAARASGFPRLVRQGGRLVVAWVEIEGDRPSRVRVAELAPVKLG